MSDRPAPIVIEALTDRWDDRSYLDGTLTLLRRFPRRTIPRGPHAAPKDPTP